jgi:hypothetical protein
MQQLLESADCDASPERLAAALLAIARARGSCREGADHAAGPAASGGGEQTTCASYQRTRSASPTVHIKPSARMLDALLPNPVIRIAPPVLVAIPNKHPPPASQRSPSGLQQKTKRARRHATPFECSRARTLACLPLTRLGLRPRRPRPSALRLRPLPFINCPASRSPSPLCTGSAVSSPSWHREPTTQSAVAYSRLVPAAAALQSSVSSLLALAAVPVHEDKTRQRANREHVPGVG